MSCTKLPRPTGKRAVFFTTGGIWKFWTQGQMNSTLQQRIRVNMLAMQSHWPPLCTVFITLVTTRLIASPPNGHLDWMTKQIWKIVITDHWMLIYNSWRNTSKILTPHFSAVAFMLTEPGRGTQPSNGKAGDRDQAVCGKPDTLTHIYIPGESLVKMLSTKGVRIKYC